MADYFFAHRFSCLKAILLPLIGLISALWAGDCSGQMYYSATPNYYPYTVARPQDRDWIRNLPMEQRPNRPLHFYGNWVRRSYSVQRPSYRAPRTPVQAAPVDVIPTVEIQPSP